METLRLSRRTYRHLKPRGPSRLTIPSRVSPHVRLVFEEMKRQCVTYDDLEERSGVRRAALKAWRHKNKPGLDSMEAVLGALGWDFVPIPRAKTLPADLAAELAPIAERFGLTMQGTAEALIALVTGIHTSFASTEMAPSTAPTLEEVAA